ncbi:MAG TPA: hypothetical protein VMT62_00615, partial [Syntrophorhabdaceae bacterium]|nr:hypothetical protein [Syntrophorhabdaceae bacterium]
MAFSSRTTKITGEHIHLSALFLFAFIVLMVFRIKTPDDGDTYAYANSISTFAGPVIHFGYFVVGFLLHSFLQKIGVNALQTLGYMSVLFGSLSVACIYLFTLELTGDRIQGLLAGLVLLFSGTFWLFAEHGEVYVPQLAIILLATIAMLKRRPFMASIFFLIAMSITPTSCLVFPPLLYIAHYRGLTKKDVAWFAIPAFCSLFLVFLLAFHQVVAIMKWATYSPRVFFSNLTVREGVITLIYQLLVVYLKPFNVCIAFAAVGAFYLYRHDKKIFFLMVWFMLPFIAYIFNLGLISGDHLIITFIVVSFLVSYLLSRLLQAKDGNIA